MNPFHLEWEQQDLDIFFTFYRREQNSKLKMCTGATEKQGSAVEHICYSPPVQTQGGQPAPTPVRSAHAARSRAAAVLTDVPSREGRCLRPYGCRRGTRLCRGRGRH